MPVKLDVLTQPDSQRCLLAISKNGKTDEEIIAAVQDSIDYFLKPFNYSPTDCLPDVFSFSNAANAIGCIVLLGVSQIIPYRSEIDRNKSLFKVSELRA